MFGQLLVSASRSPRFLPLTNLDIALALGKLELAGDAEDITIEEAALYGRDVFEESHDEEDEWWEFLNPRDDFLFDDPRDDEDDPGYKDELERHHEEESLKAEELSQDPFGFWED